MGQRHRKNFNDPGHAHELTFSCYKRYPFLKSDRTCQWLADAINEARRDLNFDLWAYVFMPDHAHIIICPKPPLLGCLGSTGGSPQHSRARPQYDIAAIRKAIKSPVGAKGIEYLEQNAPDWMPRITRRRGDKTERLFWQSGGGYDRNITDGKTLLKMIDYLHLNPVRKSLVQQARKWQWSSAAWYEGVLQGAVLSIDPIPSDWLNS